jgi:hypothetical protein
MQALARLASLVALPAMLTGPVAAQTIEWNNPAGGDWDVASNWSPMNVPDTPGETASFSLPGAYTVTLASARTVGALALHNPDAVLALHGGAVLTVADAVLNHAEIIVNPHAEPAGAAIHAPADLDITGAGRIVLADADARITSAPDATIFVHTPHRISGGGTITASLRSDGVTTADRPASPLVFSAGPKAFSNFIFVDDGAALIVTEAELDLDGGVLLTYTGEIVFDHAALRAGSVDAVTQGTVTIAGDSTFDATLSLGALRVLPGVTLTLTNGFANHGLAAVNPDDADAPASVHIAAPGMTLSGNGVLLLAGHGHRSTITGHPFTNAHPHRIAGLGHIAAPLTNQGRLEPGAQIHHPGVLTADAPIVFSMNGSSYRCDVTPDASDRIDSASSVHVGGTLWIELAPGVDPDDWSATVVTAAGGVTGRFLQLLAPAPTDTRLRVRAEYRPNEIRVGAACAADYDLNDLLNFFDVTAYLALYLAQDREADLALPFGAFNFLDIAAFLDHYNAGCP